MAISIINNIFERFKEANYTSGTVYSSRLTNCDVSYLKIGNFCFIEGVAKTASALSADAAIITDIPAAGHNSGFPVNIVKSDHSANYTGYVNQYGSLCIGANIPTNTWILISGIYPTAV